MIFFHLCYLHMLNITNTYFENMVFDILLHEFKIFFQTSNVEFLKYYFRFIILFCSRSQRLSFQVNVNYQYMYEQHNFILFNSNSICFLFLEKYFRFIAWIYATIGFQLHLIAHFLAEVLDCISIRFTGC